MFKFTFAYMSTYVQILFNPFFQNLNHAVRPINLNVLYTSVLYASFTISIWS